MSSTLQLKEQNFQLELPQSFEINKDGDSLTCVCKEPAGVLTIIHENVENPEELPNLSRMLAGFLTRSGHPVATDELLPMTSVPGTPGFSWQYIDGARFFRFWLFGTRQCWVLLTFVCPEENKVDFHQVLEESIKSLRLRRDES